MTEPPVVLDKDQQDQQHLDYGEEAYVGFTPSTQHKKKFKLPLPGRRALPFFTPPSSSPSTPQAPKSPSASSSVAQDTDEAHITSGKEFSAALQGESRAPAAVMSAQASPDMANRVIVAAPKGQRTFAQGAAKKFEDMPKFEQVKGPGPKKLALPELPKEVGPEYKAQPYWLDSKTAPPEGKEPEGTVHARPVYYNRLRVLNPRGILAMVLYTAALGFYIWIRVTKTLGLAQYTSYGVIVFIVEMLGASTVFLYGINLIFTPAIVSEDQDLVRPSIHEATPKALKRLRHDYHVRVLVPCYKEDTSILQRTCACALACQLPPGCSRTVYLCDDGKSPDKRKWVESMGPGLVYVSGRQRPVGEMNGKSGNLNNCFSQLYPEGCTIPTNELMCIFDADQVPARDFFVKTLFLFDGGEDVGMVLSPQAFHNLNPYADIFNHANIHFWEYMQPGYDALNFISCTGTNFLMRAQAFSEAGLSPTYTLTEDFALGMAMKKTGWQCRYVQEYCALGEAPEQVRNCYQQRSRWCKGHFQIILNRQHCPLLQKDLSIPMRIMYASGVWSYVVGAISTPFFIIVPMVTIWGGIFPIVVTWWAALGLTVYYLATNNVLFYTRNVQHMQALWFANCANTLLWWTYVKACNRALSTLLGLSSITFKTTLKGRTMAMAGAARDLWMQWLVFIALGVTIIAGLIKLFSATYISTPLSISILWALYNIIPPSLVLLYNPLRGTPWLSKACAALMFLSFFFGITAVALMWRTSPNEYPYGGLLNDSMYFFRSQRLGYLPASNDVSWRSSALTYELGPDSTDLTGGWYTGGEAGLTKMTLPTAFTTAVLAWGLLTFPQGYSRSQTTSATVDEVRWGAQYLLSAIGGEDAPYLVSQVGNQTLDTAYWGRPEDFTAGRPYYSDAATSADLAGAVAAGLAASALVLADTRLTPLASDSNLAKTLSNAAVSTYSLAYGMTGSYVTAKSVCQTSVLSTSAAATAAAAASPASEAHQSAGNGAGTLVAATDCTRGFAGGLYAPFSTNDARAWAAAWMYKMDTSSTRYFNEAKEFLDAWLLEVQAAGKTQNTPLMDATHYGWATMTLLAQLSPGASNLPSAFLTQAEAYLGQWICAGRSSGQISYTPAGRAYCQANAGLGTTANSVFLALVFQDVIRDWRPDLADIYLCWAREQSRYMVGEIKHSFVVGYGTRSPEHINEAASSCPRSASAACTSDAEFAEGPNPWTLRGALVRGPYSNDILVDSRTSTQTYVQVEANAGWSSALAGLADAPGQFAQCLQSYSIFAANYTACPKLNKARPIQ